MVAKDAAQIKPAVLLMAVVVHWSNAVEQVAIPAEVADVAAPMSDVAAA